MSLPRCRCGFVMPGTAHGRECKLYDVGQVYGPQTSEMLAALARLDREVVAKRMRAQRAEHDLRNAKDVLARIRHVAGLKPGDGVSLVEHVHGMRREIDELKEQIDGVNDSHDDEADAHRDTLRQLGEAKARAERLRKSRERWRAFAERLRYVSPTVTNRRDRKPGTCACGKWGLGGVADAVRVVSVRIPEDGRGHSSTHRIDRCEVSDERGPFHVHVDYPYLDPNRASGAV
jgi:hypothetical protein